MNVSSPDTIRQELEQSRMLVDAELERILPPEQEYPSSIHKAMRYSVFAGGKRLRPTLCLEAGRLFGGDEAVLLRVGSALELIHTYSLIHDDLPSMDNDDLRRGLPTVHRKFNEAVALLAGDGAYSLETELLRHHPLELADLQVVAVEQRQKARLRARGSPRRYAQGDRLRWDGP